MGRSIEGDIPKGRNSASSWIEMISLIKRTLISRVIKVVQNIMWIVGVIGLVCFGIDICTSAS